MNGTTWVWPTAAGFFAGLTLGLVVGGLSNAFRRQARHLERELNRSREEMADYRRQVTEHFAGTADLFNGLSDSYQALYRHLAGGCQDLCREQAPRLPQRPEVKPIPVAGKKADARSEERSPDEAPLSDGIGIG
jgi:uncharacterized membrane-anchored protein YhcB (DUF1043 family)